MSSAGPTTANLILSAASQLTAAQFKTYQRLCKRLLHGPQFQLIVLDCRDERLQQQLQQLLAGLCQQANLPATQLVLDDSIPDVFSLQQQLQSLASQVGVIQLTGAALWFSQPNRWAAFNLLRENIASQSPCRLLLWLNAESIAAMIEQAPDWWAWRSGVYEFENKASETPKRPDPVTNTFKNKQQHKNEAQRRLATLTDWLSSEEGLDPELAAPLWFELGTLYQQLGEWDQAIEIYRSQCLPMFQLLSDARNAANTQGKIADILMLRGQFELALDIRKQQLIVYEELNDQHNVAITQGKLADILFRSNEPEEALHILKNAVLPFFHIHGDLRNEAITQGKIADYLTLKGELEKALQIRQLLELPVYQKLGDIRNEAITLGQIAGIFIQFGELSKALKILQQDILPVFQKLGDIRHEAVTQGSIADIFEMQGDFDKAFQIRQNLELPKYQTIGDSRSAAIVQQQIAGYRNKLNE